MKKGAISIIVIISVLWVMCSLIINMEETNNDATKEIIHGKDYGENISPLYSLRNKFI